MDDRLIEIMQDDIKRCEEAQSTADGSYQLYQILVGKYNGIFDNFEKDIPKTGKVAFNGPFNYRPELNAIKEKLKLLLITQNDDPLFAFKSMMNADIDLLKAAIADHDNAKTSESDKLKLYKDVTAKYHTYVPNLGDGLYQYNPNFGFYDDVTGDSLLHNLNQVYNKLLTFKSLSYPNLEKSTAQNIPMVQINNSNENTVSLSVTFDNVREQIENMSALSADDINETLKKIDEIEAVIKSSDKKYQKWNKLKDIIKWIADKGVDVGIALLPLLLKIK